MKPDHIIHEANDGGKRGVGVGERVIMKREVNKTEM